MDPRILYVFVIAFLTGVAVGGAWSVSFAGAGFVVLVGACLGAYMCVAEKGAVLSRPLFLAALALLALGCGMARVDAARRWSDAGMFDAQLDTRVDMRGVVADEP